MKKKIKRTPVKKSSDSYSKRKTMLKWKTMREVEKRRISFSKRYTRYKNNWMLQLVSEVTRITDWSRWDELRLKRLRKNLEKSYNIPINFLSAFIYFSTYKYMYWPKRDPTFKNYIGFISNEAVVLEFAQFISTRSLLWRKKNSRWPDDFEERWGMRLSSKAQKLGINDKIVEIDLLSDRMMTKINRHL